MGLLPRDPLTALQHWPEFPLDFGFTDVCLCKTHSHVWQRKFLREERPFLWRLDSWAGQRPQVPLGLPRTSGVGQDPLLLWGPVSLGTLLWGWEAFPETPRRLLPHVLARCGSCALPEQGRVGRT